MMWGKKKRKYYSITHLKDNVNFSRGNLASPSF